MGTKQVWIPSVTLSVTKCDVDVQVSMDDMRQKQFKAGGIVLDRQQRFLASGRLPGMPTAAAADVDDEDSDGEGDDGRASLYHLDSFLKSMKVRLESVSWKVGIDL